MVFPSISEALEDIRPTKLVDQTWCVRVTPRLPDAVILECGKYTRLPDEHTPGRNDRKKH